VLTFSYDDSTDHSRERRLQHRTSLSSLAALARSASVRGTASTGTGKIAQKSVSLTTSPALRPHSTIIVDESDVNVADRRAAPSKNTVDAKAVKAQTRRPSPGLAARLKALGFGGSPSATKESTPPPNNGDHIGRLPEDQLRQLDGASQSTSTNEANGLERRGRRKGGIGLPHLPSLSSLRGSTAAAASALAAVVTNNSSTSKISLAPSRPASPSPSLSLPEIVPTEPLNMDTQKYRLPDHANGFKTQVETRQEHIHRKPVPTSAPLVSVSVSSLAKDLPPVPTPSGAEAFDASSYFNPLGLQRPGSIYTLSRASFANQLAQLTSLQLPDAESLSGKVSAIPTAPAAAKALIHAADQIRGWISKATEVVEGLDSDDDVEWAAAGGREGLEEVESAITRFEELITVYVSAIEGLQARDDITDVSSDDLNRAVTQMETIMNDWVRIKTVLHDIKAQVEVAMEWEELWNNVLGDIQGEMDELSQLVFEMEERRHKSMMSTTNVDSVDIGDLETIVEETPPPAVRQQANKSNRLSLNTLPMSPTSPSEPTASQDDSTLMSLVARMQPLRASLDFLPMRLSHFEARAQPIFPTACDELDMRRDALDGTYKKLEKDAQSLQKELGEDRWVVVFRGAGRQAQKMYDSVEKSVSRLKEAIDSGMHLKDQPTMSKRLESYENRKTHYGPAIERVLTIIDRGVKDRLTVNGEIVRLHAETQAKWDQLKERTREMDLAIEEIQADKKGQQLRDSVSSMLSNDRSTVGSGNDTPGSSPPSSVIMQSLGFERANVTPKTGKSRSSSVGSHLPQPPSNRRHSSMPIGTSGLPRKPLASRMSTLGIMPTREGSATPVGNRIPRPTSTLTRPKWNSSTKASDVDTGHNFKPMSLTSPSPYARPAGATIRSSSALGMSKESKLPLRSPLSRAASSSPIPEDTPSRTPAARLSSFRDRLASPGPYAQQTLSRPRLANQTSMSGLNNRRASLQPQAKLGERSVSDTSGLGAATPARPASSLASSRRSSLLPQPKGQGGVTATADGSNVASGRASPQAVAGARMAMRKTSSSMNLDTKNGLANRPKWRG
jgi:hypothetical protein